MDKTNPKRSTRWCKHHEPGDKPLEHKCTAGVDIAQLVPPGQFGGAYMLPCHDNHHDTIQKAKCPKRLLPSDEEQAEIDAERERFAEECKRRLLLTLPLVAEVKDRGGVGESPCPVCESGTVAWSVADYNRHVRMRCSTDDCVNFME